MALIHVLFLCLLTKVANLAPLLDSTLRCECHSTSTPSPHDLKKDIITAANAIIHKVQDVMRCISSQNILTVAEINSIKNLTALKIASLPAKQMSCNTEAYKTAFQDYFTCLMAFLSRLNVVDKEVKSISFQMQGAIEAVKFLLGKVRYALTCVNVELDSLLPRNIPISPAGDEKDTGKRAYAHLHELELTMHNFTNDLKQTCNSGQLMVC